MRTALLASLAAALLTAPALAQPSAPTAPTSPTAPTPPKPTPPEILSQRIAAVRRQTTVAPVLVLVDSWPAYYDAIARWHNGKERVLYPVLMDNGSGAMEMNEDIARFARAFKPALVVRYHVDNTTLLANPTADSIAAAVHASFGAKNEADYLAALAARKGAPGPLGAILTAPGEGAPAAAALAAAYGQVLIFTTPQNDARANLTFTQADALSSAITKRLDELKIPYAGMGDQIDAITLCLNRSMKITAGNSDAPTNPIAQIAAKPGEGLALTDIVGRATTGNRQGRWAYAAQTAGADTRQAYMAMSAIFLQPTSAAAFNGYDHTGDWAMYNPAEGLKVLEAGRLKTAVLDKPNQSIDDWRNWTGGSFTPAVRWAKTAGPQPAGGALTADLFLINTMGNHNFFQLQPGLGYAGDAPILNTPAAVNFTHSWSLSFSSDPWAVGGRWLDRGAFCYVGSVHEPFLNAFVPQSIFAVRLARGWPIAAAARFQPEDRTPFAAPWRIAVVGDALWTLGPALKRTENLIDLPGMKPVNAETAAEQLKAGQYARGLDTLAILGRDADAARIARAALADQPEKIDIFAAFRAVHLAYRTGDLDTLVKAAQKIDLPGQRDLAIADEIWHALWPQLNGNMTAEQAQLLTKTIRNYSYAWDTITAATALKRTVGHEAARAFFEQQRDKAPREDIKRELDAAASQFR